MGQEIFCRLRAELAGGKARWSPQPDSSRLTWSRRGNDRMSRLRLARRFQLPEKTDSEFGFAAGSIRSEITSATTTVGRAMPGLTAQRTTNLLQDVRLKRFYRLITL